MAAGLVVVAIPLLAVGMDVPMSRPGIAMPMGRGGAPPGRDHFPPLGFGLIAFSGTVLILGLGAPAGPAGGAYGYEAFSCAAIIGRLTAASFFDRGWRVAAILCCSGLVVAASVAPVLAGSGASLAVGAVCLGLGYGGFLPLAVTFARERRPAGRERVSAGMFHASCVGIAVGAALPLLADHAPPSVMPGLVVAATVAAFVLWFLVVSQRR
jgi:MFS family permease